MARSKPQGPELGPLPPVCPCPHCPSRVLPLSCVPPSVPHTPVHPASRSRLSRVHPVHPAPLPCPPRRPTAPHPAPVCPASTPSALLPSVPHSPICPAFPVRPSSRPRLSRVPPSVPRLPVRPVSPCPSCSLGGLPRVCICPARHGGRCASCPLPAHGRAVPSPTLLSGRDPGMGHRWRLQRAQQAPWTPPPVSILAPTQVAPDRKATPRRPLAPGFAAHTVWPRGLTLRSACSFLGEPRTGLGLLQRPGTDFISLSPAPSQQPRNQSHDQFPPPEWREAAAPGAAQLPCEGSSPEHTSPWGTAGRARPQPPWAGCHSRARPLPVRRPGGGWGGSVSPSLTLLPSRPEEPSTWTGYMGKMFLAASSYLPTQVSDMMNQDRAFATGRLGFSGHRNICTLATYVQPHTPPPAPARQKPSLIYFPKCGMPQTCKRI